MLVSQHGTRDEVRQRSLLREVNERIRELTRTSAVEVDAGRFEVVCECGFADCWERVAMTLNEYGEIRRRAGTFLVTAGHERSGFDRVVTACPSYHVVEVLSSAGADAARATSSNGRTVGR